MMRQRLSDGTWRIEELMLPFNVTLSVKGATLEEAKANMKLAKRAYRQNPPVEKFQGAWVRKSVAKARREKQKESLVKSLLWGKDET